MDEIVKLQLIQGPYAIFFRGKFATSILHGGSFAGKTNTIRPSKTPALQKGRRVSLFFISLLIMKHFACILQSGQPGGIGGRVVRCRSHGSSDCTNVCTARRANI